MNKSSSFKDSQDQNNNIPPRIAQDNIVALYDTPYNTDLQEHNFDKIADQTNTVVDPAARKSIIKLKYSKTLRNSEIQEENEQSFMKKNNSEDTPIHNLSLSEKRSINTEEDNDQDKAYTNQMNSKTPMEFNIDLPIEKEELQSPVKQFEMDQEIENEKENEDEDSKNATIQKVIIPEPNKFQQEMFLNKENPQIVAEENSNVTDKINNEDNKIEIPGLTFSKNIRFNKNQEKKQNQKSKPINLKNGIYRGNKNKNENEVTTQYKFFNNGYLYSKENDSIRKQSLIKNSPSNSKTFPDSKLYNDESHGKNQTSKLVSSLTKGINSWKIKMKRSEKKEEKATVNSIWKIIEKKRQNFLQL